MLVLVGGVVFDGVGDEGVVFIFELIEFKWVE